MGKQLKKINRKKEKQFDKEILRKAFDKGYKAGEEEGVRKAINYIEERLKTLHELKGVGSTLGLRVAEHMGFEKIVGDSDENKRVD